MQTFTEWWDNIFEAKPYSPLERSDMLEAYEAGWNACRDQWGGLTYSQTKPLTTDN